LHLVGLPTHTTQ
jgi:hypothetical protein